MRILWMMLPQKGRGIHKGVCVHSDYLASEEDSECLLLKVGAENVRFLYSVLFLYFVFLANQFQTRSQYIVF